MSMVRASYDREANALYVRLRDEPVARTVEVTDLHMVDLDANGLPVGIEILTPHDPRLDEIAERFHLFHLLPAMEREVEAALSPTCTYSGNLILFLSEATFRAEDFAIPAYQGLALPSASGSIALDVGVIEKMVLSNDT